MFCYQCGCELGRSDHCPNCGVNVVKYKKIIYTSNYLYNDGLQKAQVRDLSGAILSLKNSLWYNKDNLDARNLLGLIYYEIGETVAALAEWVISKNINDERLHRKKNIGADYLEQVQASRQTMENLDSMIARYNQALDCCYTDNLDVAVLQLKKVLQINPHYLRARQLLALLYIEDGQFKRSYRELQKCQRLDVSNTTTLYYMQEVERILGLSDSESAAGQTASQHTVRTVKTAGSGEEDAQAVGAGKQTRRGKNKKQKLKPGMVITYTDGNETIIQPVNRRNPGVDGFGLPSWIYGGVIGAIVGAAVIMFVVMPARVQSIRSDAQDQIRTVSEEMNNREIEISDLELQVDDLTAQIEELELAALAEEEDEGGEDKINALMSSAAFYIEDSVDIANAAAAMEAILPSTAAEDMSEEFIQLYEQLFPLLRMQILQDHADAGILAYEAEEPDYAYVVEELTFANAFEDPEDYGSTWPLRQYYLADSYYQLYLADPDGADAQEYLSNAREVIADLAAAYPDSEYTELANELLELLPEETGAGTGAASSEEEETDAAEAAAEEEDSGAEEEAG